MKMVLSEMFLILSMFPLQNIMEMRTCLIPSLSNFKYQCGWKEMDVIQELDYTLEFLKKKKNTKEKRKAPDGLSSPKSQT